MRESKVSWTQLSFSNGVHLLNEKSSHERQEKHAHLSCTPRFKSDKGQSSTNPAK